MPEEERTSRTVPPGPPTWLGKSAPVLFSLGLAIFFVVSTAALTLTRVLTSAGTRQPIEFNHKKHVEENGLACAECHEFAEDNAFSGLPSAELCAFCHAEAQGESAEEQRLVQLLEEGAPLNWKPLFREPPHVYYSHRRHVGVAELDCQICHGTFAETTAPPAKVKRLTMEDCLDCHRREGVSEQCTACHR